MAKDEPEELSVPGAAPEPTDTSSDNTATPVASDASRQPDSPCALPFPVVAIGGSAGSVEAYIELFRNLDPDTGMAFVLISHLQAAQKSHLPEIIGRCTKMKTAAIENGIRPEPNHVYMLPPNARAGLEGGVFRLEERTAETSFHPIDYFFQSVAVEQKNLAVGVVLSGMDADGSIGVKAIKSEGGITIVQSPESARYPEMPRSSISADHVDLVLRPDQIATHLGLLAQSFQTEVLRTLEEGRALPNESKHLERILKLLKYVSGVDFRLYKSTTLRRRIARRMLIYRLDSLADYAMILQSDPKELRELQEDILISVTRFFRDADVFNALKHVVFEHLFRNRSPEQQVRIWVPGCSSGEEVYSIAISLLEFLTGSAVEPPIQIFGTDASETSIQKARVGVYPETITSEVSPERLRRFFMKTDKGYQVGKRVRDLCIFARQNLCNDPPFSRLDLVSCRNTLIYFGTQLQRQLIPTFHYSLRDEGFLLLGSSETIREFTDLFRLVDKKNKIYTKIGTTPARTLLDVAPRVFVPNEFASEVTDLVTDRRWTDPELQRGADRIVLARYGPPGVVVNERLEILQFRGHTSPFFELPQGTATLQLGRIVRENIAPVVTAAVKRSIDEDLPVRVDNLQVRDGDQTCEATLEVLPMHNVGSRWKGYLVVFVSSSGSGNSRPVPPAGPAVQVDSEQDRDRIIAQLQHDLTSTKLYLHALLEERDAKNQELISANEEIQSANEELQSANEELETTKEELQSSNEELQTVNDELQSRNQVLTQATNDLSNLLNSVNLPLLMLGNEFQIRHFTPQMQRLMNLRAGDIGRPFSDIRLNLNIENLEPLFTDVLDTLGARELEVQDREGHWYLLRVRPYRTADNKIDGLVVVLVDIDQLRRSQQGLRDARDFATSIIESVPLPLAVVDSDLRIRSANEAFRALVGSSGHALEGRYLPDLAGSLWGMEQPLNSLLEKLNTDEKDSRQSFEFEYKASGESLKVFLVRGRTMRPDGERFLLVTFEDITAHKDVERLLQAESERLASEVESTAKELDRSREELRALTGNLMTSQEEERRRVARELHDDVSQRLASLSLEADDILRNLISDPKEARQRLEKIFEQLGQLSEDVRQLSHGLHPTIIDDLGLSAALRILTNEFGEREGMITTFAAQDVPEEIPVEIATGLYRVAQEALRNIAKHAGHTHVKIVLAAKEGGLELQISDAGRGFDTHARRAGLGLISMQERARLIGGSFKIHSAPMEGTKLTVFVPMAELRERRAETR
jgi:two-component system CheB/CheR fusion protein